MPKDRTRSRLRLEPLEARDVPAALGELDPTFATGGVGIYPAFPLWSFGDHQDVTVDGAGRVLVYGNTMSDDVAVHRTNPDGTIDTSFGTGGTARLPFERYDTPGGLAVDTAGNVVVGVSIDTYLAGPEVVGNAVVRLRPDGSYDPTFGTNGVVRLQPPPGYTVMGPSDVAIDAAGDVLVTGGIGGADPATAGVYVARLTPAGRPDPRFNHGAPLIVTHAPLWPVGIAVDPAGRVVVGGSSQPAAGPTATGFGAWRVNPDGTTDRSFGADGFAAFPMAGFGGASAVGVDAAGAVYVGGTWGNQGVVAKFTPAGVPDVSFGTGGEFVSPLGSGPGPYDAIRGLAVTPDGRVVGAQTVQTSPTDGEFGVFLLTPGGQLDPAFNPAGPTPGANVFDLGGHAYDRAAAVSFTPDGRIVAGGFTGTPVAAELARLGGPGTGRPVLGGVGTDPGLDGPPPNPFAALGVPVRTTTGDFDGDGVADTAFVTGPGTPTRVAVVSGADNTTVLVGPFDPFGDGFTGGGFVAAGDFDRDGRAELVVTADAGGGPRVAVFAAGAGGAAVPRADFLGIDDPAFRGGSRVAVGDVNGDGTPDLVVCAGSGGGPRAALFDGASLFTGSPARLVSDFFAFPGADAAALRDGAYVSVGDIDGDGKADLVFGGGPGGAPRVLVLSGAVIAGGDVAAALAAPVANFYVGGDTDGRSGVRVAALDTAAGRADLAVQVPASATPPVRVYSGDAFPAPGEPAAVHTFTAAEAADLAGGAFTD